MSLLPKSNDWCRRYSSKFNSGWDIPRLKPTTPIRPTLFAPELAFKIAPGLFGSGLCCPDDVTENAIITARSGDTLFISTTFLESSREPRTSMFGSGSHRERIVSIFVCLD